MRYTMSNAQYAFLQRAQVPDRDALQASIDRLGFDLKLHPEYTPFSDCGFLPFVLNGKSGPGYEVFYAPTTEVADGDDSLLAIAKGRDSCITMVWRGSMKDLACVMIVSCALTKDFGAVVSYEGEPPSPLGELLVATQEAVRDAQREA
jgi:hypothetical protein